MPDIETEAPALFRGMLRDLVPCSDYDEVCALLGLIPAGNDVDDAEHYESHVRIMRFLPIAEETLIHADVAADVLHRLTHLNGCDEETDEAGLALYQFITRTTCSAVITHLLQKGTLNLGDES